MQPSPHAPEPSAASGPAPGDPVPSLVNWDLAASTAARLMPAGPRVGRRQAEAETEGLRRAAETAVGQVHRLTGLEAARDLRDSEVLIVDRATWAQANVQSFATLLTPGFEVLRAERPEEYAQAANPITATAAGVEAGTVLSFLGSKVLGQYEPFCALPGPEGQPLGPAGGRLMLVAPNVAQVREEINVEPEDFRLWVCLHEQTHRVQFAAAPWLREHLRAEITALVTGMFAQAESLPERLGSSLKALANSVRGEQNQSTDDDAAPRAALTGARGTTAGDTTPEPAGAQDEQSGVPASSRGLLDLIQDPESQARMSHLTAVMSLLEGHANMVMDAVDSSVVPTVKTIRRRFEARSAQRSALDRWVRRLMGMDAKMRQYRDGQRFVDHAVAELGMDSFNRVWESPEHLPTEVELHRPQLWVDRMQGRN